MRKRSPLYFKPGYSIDPVLSDLQSEPAAIQFEWKWRMYVLELRTYMQDLDANGDWCRLQEISRWEDKDNDGTYETGVVLLR